MHINCKKPAVLKMSISVKLVNECRTEPLSFVSLVKISRPILKLTWGYERCRLTKIIPKRKNTEWEDFSLTPEIPTGLDGALPRTQTREPGVAKRLRCTHIKHHRSEQGFHRNAEGQTAFLSLQPRVPSCENHFLAVPRYCMAFSQT